MKHLFKLSLVALLALTAVVSSCTKYEEGSNFSIISAKARLAGDWKLTSYTVDGTDYTANLGTRLVTIEKDGTYSGSDSYDLFGATFTDTYTGTWQFNDDKSTVSFLETGGSSAEVYTIIELKNKEIKFQQIINDNTSIFTYTAQ